MRKHQENTKNITNASLDIRASKEPLFNIRTAFCLCTSLSNVQLFFVDVQYDVAKVYSPFHSISTDSSHKMLPSFTKKTQVDSFFLFFIIYL